MSELPAEFTMPPAAFERQRLLLSIEVTKAHGGTRSRKRLGIALALASLALLAAIATTPARGVGERIVDLIWSPSAPPAVQTSFASSDPLRKMLLAQESAAGVTLQDRYSAVIATKARGIFAIDASDGQPVYLWAAPTEDGRECWLIQTSVDASGQVLGGGSCDSLDRSAPFLPGDGWSIDRPTIQVVSARVYDSAITDIEVELRGAPALTLPVVAGYALGTVPNDQPVLAFTGHDASGHEIGRVTLRGR